MPEARTDESETQTQHGEIMILGLIVVAGVGAAAALGYYAHKLGAATVKADIQAEIAKLEAEAVTDAKAAIARIKALL